jgi:hypothetical protein
VDMANVDIPGYCCAQVAATKLLMCVSEGMNPRASSPTPAPATPSQEPDCFPEYWLK